MSATHKINITMRQAIINLRVMRSAHKAIDTEASKGCISYLIKAPNNGAGVINRPDWNANLSFKTAKLLHAPDFYAGKVKGSDKDIPWNNHVGKRNAFDMMVHG